MNFFKKTVKVQVLVMIAALVLTACSSVAGQDTSLQGTENQTLIIGTSQLGGVFGPVFAVSGYDSQVADLTTVTLLSKDRNGMLTDGGALYAEPVMVTNDKGEVEKTVYTFRLQDQLKFSDGSDVTVNDVIFSFKVLCDPSYDGPYTVSALNIEGINEYRYDDTDYEANIAKLKIQAENIEQDEVLAYIEKCAQNDYDTYGADEFIAYTGFENDGALSNGALKEALIQAYYEIEKNTYFEYYIEGAKEDKLNALTLAYVQERLGSGGENVPDISGIRAVNDQTVEVTILGVNAPAAWELGSVPILSEHYYGQAFKKGDVSTLKTKNSLPFGAGPYIFDDYANNVVSFRANPYYYKGEPQIENLKMQVIGSDNQLETVIQGQVDIASPLPSADTVLRADEAGIHYELADSNSYGYIGICAANIPDLYERQAIMYLINKEPAVKSYYGETAQVIQRPISSSSWASPEHSDAVYGYDPQKALEYFKKAGWEQTEQNGKKVLVKDGEQLTLKAAIDGEGKMNHPSAPILTQMKIDLENMGGVLEINDCDINILAEGLENGDWDIWAASWQLDVDPDMSAKYQTGAVMNYYGLSDENLDALLNDARMTTNMQKRKGIYQNCMNIVMEQAVEMPVYQRKDMYVFNGAVVDLSSLPENETCYYNYWNEIHTLKLIAQ